MPHPLSARRARALAACLALPPLVHAQTAPVVVVSATRVARPALDVPAAIDVVTAAQLGAGHARVNLSEALAAVPGLIIQNRQNYAQDLQVSVRGFGTRSAFGVRGVRLITDGIPATLPDGQGQAATFNLDVAERIEVLRGPFSAVYGNHAGGVVALFSRAAGGPTRLELNTSAGSAATGKVDANLAGSAAGLDYLLDASRFRTASYRDHSAATRTQTFAKLAPAWNLPGRLTIIGATLAQHGTQDPLGVGWATWQRDPRAGEPDPADTAGRTYAQRYDTRKSIAHAQLGARFELPAAGGHLVISGYGGNRHVLQFLAFSRGFQTAPGNSGGVVDFTRRFDGAALRWSAQRDIAGGTLTTVAGVDVDRSHDARTGYENFAGAALGVRGALRRDEDDELASVEPYAQLEWAHGPWRMHAGLRHARLRVDVVDHFLGNGDDSGQLSFARTTPVLGLVRHLSARASVYASAARGFETPTLNELFYSAAAGPNYGLRPATSTHAEIGWKASSANGARLQAALFQARTRDELVVAASSGGRTSYRNAGATARQGAELSAHGCVTPAMCITAAGTWLRAVYVDASGPGAAGNRLPGTPAASGYADVAWHAGAADVALEANLRGRIFADDANAAPPAPGYALLNARLGLQQAWAGWTWKEFIRVDNIANRRYIGSVIVGDATGRYYEPGPGRHWLAGFTVARRFE
jgi:iron complex outermembrane receptor protein